MAYVHGHGRRIGWVIGHYRRPNRPGPEQMPLLVPVVCAPEVAVPAPRVSPEARRPARAGTPADRG